MRKSKAILFFITLLFVINQAHGQQYGNEWINYDQDYYKIKTGKSGIHRLTYDNLLAAGVPLSALDPRNLQLFHRGEEVSIHIQGEEDGVFDSADYIDFFGSKNDGTQDTELYLRPSYQAHTYYNLFSDTTAYFLTPSSSLGKRMPLLDDPATGLTPESHHLNEILDVQKSQFSFGQYYPIGNVGGETKLAQYDLGQGWIGNNIEKNEQTIVNGTNYRDFAGPLTDGSYNLQVEARDASGNQSGINPYTINFEVVNESSISSFYPYPNPFSTSTRFVFTITGDMLPDNLKIQIFTMTGKVVREITQAELGPIQIGNNISDFAWDGFDEFGDQLANGNYLYRVIAKINGQDIGHRGTGGDKGFRKGWGKLVILR